MIQNKQAAIHNVKQSLVIAMFGFLLGFITLVGCGTGADPTFSETEGSGNTGDIPTGSDRDTKLRDTGDSDTVSDGSDIDADAVATATDEIDTHSDPPESTDDIDAGSPPAPDDYQLIGAPMLFAPTHQGFGLSVVLESGDASGLVLQLRQEGSDEWRERLTPSIPEDQVIPDVARWDIDGLTSETAYVYQVIGLPISNATEDALLFEGRAMTARNSGASFSFALITDSHIGGDPAFTNQGDSQTLTDVMTQVDASDPDFLINLGDMLDFHQWGFNDPPPTGEVVRAAYWAYRDLLGDTVARAPHFAVIGNWEGENGSYTEEDILRSRTERKRYMPGPGPDTYAAGGSPDEDYYAFTWGDALFIVLNVQSYTPTEHLIDTNGGAPEDWTLGETQLNWLTATLENAESKWRFVCIHHAVGGAAGTDGNSAYGRGGGQAADVGEQAVIHQLMRDNGVQIFFYGHDHVFADMVVDDIHYTLPGSAGAIWHFTSDETGYEESWLEPGWAKVDVSPDSVRVQLINLEAEILHEYTL